jgi:2-keto-4-pentenoate hydratase/2-oxohepta-3-ene-1,7-dioic acid hydratase in catechol pathway
MVDYALVNFETPDGPRAGLLVSGHVVEIGSSPPGQAFSRMEDILARWDEASTVLDTLAVDTGLPRHPVGDLTLLAPVPAPLAVYCTGANYRDHVDNMNQALGLPSSPDPHDAGLDPWFFLKSGHTVVGPDAEVMLPSKQLDWEAELTVVIGRKGKNIPLNEALQHVAGYTMANDLSARDHLHSAKAQPGTPFYYTWVQHKSFDGSCPIGPVFVPAKFVPDPQNIGIKLWVNDVLKIDSHSSRMLFTVAEQIAYLSKTSTLYPGDLILTGTPAGVGAERGEYLNRNDHIHIEMEGMGRLSTRIV